MKVALSTFGRFHHFDLARYLFEREQLEVIFSGYPKFKLRDERLPMDVIDSFPWLPAAYLAYLGRSRRSARVERELFWAACRAFELYVARRLPHCDAYLGLSTTSLRAGLRAKETGALYVCDRGSSHIRFQDRILREEYQRHGVPFPGVDPRLLRREEREYAAADVITVPSKFVQETFAAMGIPRAKVRLVPYGVDLTRFTPVAEPDPERFDVLFVGAASLRKGVPYLLDAFARLNHPRKHLTFVGSVHETVRPLINRHPAAADITCTGHRPQPLLKEVMSRSHVMVLPSIEEGLALVQAQAMACGCPVIGTNHSGADDLFDDGTEGFIVGIRDVDGLTHRLQQLADDPGLRARLSAASLRRVTTLGGWTSYGDEMMGILTSERASGHDVRSFANVKSG